MWGFRLRCFALLGAGALGLHELRYLIGYGGDAGRALAEQGHGYLDAVTAVVALTLVAALAALVAALVHGAAAAKRPPRRWRVRWLACSGALLAVFTLQELVEGALSPGHPAGLVGVAGSGGWIAVPLALAIGAAVAAPDRKVLSLNGDGAAMYTIQSLWTMARENLDVTVVVFANYTYRILNIEMQRTGAGAAGPQAAKLLELGDPKIDFVSMAKGMGLPAVRCDTAEAFGKAFAGAMAQRGPMFIEAVI